MNKKCYRYYWGLLASQAKWLNKMSDRGFRLVGTGKLLYEFESCAPGQYRYCVEFIGHKSAESARDYACFLEDLGYRVFFKNINLDWNVGKVEVRPWAESGGRIATNSTTFNRELLIVEKENDGRPFELHTTHEDQIRYCKSLRRPWLFLFLVSMGLGIFLRAWVWFIFGVIAAFGLLICQVELSRLKKAAMTREQ